MFWFIQVKMKLMKDILYNHREQRTEKSKERREYRPLWGTTQGVFSHPLVFWSTFFFLLLFLFFSFFFFLNSFTFNRNSHRSCRLTVNFSFTHPYTAEWHYWKRDLTKKKYFSCLSLSEKFSIKLILDLSESKKTKIFRRRVVEGYHFSWPINIKQLSVFYIHSSGFPF